MFIINTKDKFRGPAGLIEKHCFLLFISKSFDSITMGGFKIVSLCEVASQATSKLLTQQRIFLTNPNSKLNCYNQVTL